MAKIRLGVALGLALVLTMATVVVARGERPTPLVEALAFVPDDPQPTGLDFIDWAQLRELHGGADEASDIPLSDRRRLMLDIARSEAAPMPFGFDRLPRWSEAWGWDSLDLEWEARVYGELAVMRFAEQWDAQLFRAALISFGYRPEAIPGATVFHPDPTAEVPWHLRFANMHGLGIHGRAITQPMVQVAVSDDGRTAYFSRSGEAGPGLLTGLGADLSEVAATGFGRAAVALGRPVAASVLAGGVACSERTNGWIEGEARRLAASVGPLHRYEVLAAGYSRTRTAAPADGRYVFVYEQPQQALDDLAGRRTLIEEGFQYDDDISRYADVAFSFADAHVSGSGLVIDVTPIGGEPVHVLRNVQIKPALFATCGSLSATA